MENLSRRAFGYHFTWMVPPNLCEKHPEQIGSSHNIADTLSFCDSA
jgi:hypothetical protein